MGDNATKIDVFTAMGYCEQLQLSGYNNWRLPTEHELVRLQKYYVKEKNDYWTSENFSLESGCGTAIFAMTPRHIRCVR